MCWSEVMTRKEGRSAAAAGFHRRGESLQRPMTRTRYKDAAPGEGEGSAILAGLRSDWMAKVVGHSVNIQSMLALDAPVGHFADRRSRRVRDAGSTAEHGEPLLKIGDQIA